MEEVHPLYRADGAAALLLVPDGAADGLPLRRRRPGGGYLYAAVLPGVLSPYGDAPPERIVSVSTRQSLLQLLDDRCDVFVTTYSQGKSRHRLRNLDRQEASRMFGFGPLPPRRDWPGCSPACAGNRGVFHRLSRKKWKTCCPALRRFSAAASDPSVDPSFDDQNFVLLGDNPARGPKRCISRSVFRGLY